MAEKTYIRSIRFTEEMADLIDRQAGDSFTAKFEALVTHCVWELPAAEAELERINQQIREKRQEYKKLYHEASAIRAHMNYLEHTAKKLEEQLKETLDLMA